MSKWRLLSVRRVLREYLGGNAKLNISRRVVTTRSNFSHRSCSEEGRPFIIVRPRKRSMVVKHQIPPNFTTLTI
jgi:hypothetical protein